MTEQTTCAGRERITAATPTLCTLAGIDPPALSAADPLRPVTECMKTAGVKQVSKLLVFAPDAIGTHLYKRYTSEFDAVLRNAPIRVSLCSVMPSVTPVCYASIFTGAMPESHGLTVSTDPRPVLKCDTFFDAALRAGKRCAIATITDSSIDRLFRERDMDYSLVDVVEGTDYDGKVREIGEEFIRKGEHDIVTVYNQTVDDVQHATGPFSSETAEAMRNNIANFVKLVETAKEAWAGESWAVAFTPDHGGHLVENGRGSHGEDIPEDMHVEYFFGITPAVS